MNTKMIAAATALTALAFAGVASAQATATGDAAARSGTNQAERAGTETAAARSVARVDLALGLAQEARRNNDGDAMLVAARTLRDAQSRAVTAPAVTRVAQEGAPGQTAAEAPRAAAPMTAENLFAEARAMATGNRDLLRRVSRAEAAQARGSVTGAGYFVEDINANSHIHWDVTARGGEVWNVSAIGDGDTDVDIQVFDENGNEVCRDFGSSHRAYCSITPRWTGNFRVRVINWGSVWTRTLVTTN